VPDTFAGLPTAKTVVVADDDAVTRSLLGGILRRMGFTDVVEVRDGQKAVAAFERHQPGIMCLDIEMPGLSGFEVLAKIRESNSAVIVLMITAATTEANVRSAIEAKADGVIAKPFSAATIAREIARAAARDANAGDSKA
jgi:two-component system chemotaxis response regulator CheY